MTFHEYFKKEKDFSISAPGRVEIGGNHTDHQRGCVLAGAIDLKCRADVAKRDDKIIRIYSEGFGEISADLNNTEYSEAEEGTALSLVKGVASKFRDIDAGKLCGFDAYVSSEVMVGSGLSSSAAFEVMTGRIFNKLGEYNVCPEDIARISQYAENVYYGKPCGLMDQMACSVKGLSFIDFKDKDNPVIENAELDLKAFGYSLCVADTRADHSSLTDEYAAVPAEMKSIAAHFGKDVLSEVEETSFYAELKNLREKFSDRAVLRSMHYFAETKRARSEFEAVKNKDIEELLRLVNESGQSSYDLLQNVIPCGYKEHQDMAFTIALCKKILGSEGAVRVHGGGFAGTVLAIVHDEKLSAFRECLESVLGTGTVHILNFCND